MDPQTDAQWIESFAPYFATQQHVRICTRNFTTTEAVITQLTPHDVYLSVIYGADRQIPFTEIVDVRRVGTAALVLHPRVARHIDQIARAMAHGEYLRIETADTSIETADVQRLTLLAVTVMDVVHHTQISVSLIEIAHLVASAALPAPTHDAVTRDAFGNTPPVPVSGEYVTHEVRGE